MKYSRIQIGSSVQVVKPAPGIRQNLVGKAGIVIAKDRQDTTLPWQVAIVGGGPVWFGPRALVRRPAFRPSRSVRLSR